MNLRPLRLATLVSIILFPVLLQAQDILITDTRSASATQLMDLSWKRAANLIGSTSEVIPHSDLDSLNILLQADVVIVASGIEAVSNHQRTVLQDYVLAGGHVYVQSEFRINFSGNQLFEHLVNKTGGEFAWQGETSGNLNPTTFPSFLTGTDTPSTQEYFWNGTYGCGGETVFPIATHNDLHYGFMHISADPAIGRVMTISDQDWIKIATEVGQEHRLALLKNLLSAMTTGIENLVTPDVRISFLQQSLCPGTPFDIEANIDDTVLDYELLWFKNGVAQSDLSNKKKFESTDLEEGDLLQAKINMLAGCVTTSLESNTVQIERVLPLSMPTPTITGDTEICAGSPAEFVAIIDGMPDPMAVTYTWRIDGTDQMVNNDTLVITDPIDGSEVELSVSFNDGCTAVENTMQPLQISIVGMPVPSITLNQNKSKYCEGDDAMLSLQGLSSDYDATIIWSVNGQATNADQMEYELPSLTNSHEAYATISYTDPCKGLIQLSTQVASITIDQPKLQVEEKKNASCGRDNGTIAVLPEGGTAPYIYNWNGTEVDRILTDLPMGMQTILVTDANGCTAEVSTAIGSAEPKLIDSLVIMDQACDQAGLTLVQVYTDPAFDSDIDIRWTDSDGTEVNGNFSEGEFQNGNYTVQAAIDADCTDSRSFDVQPADIIDQVKTTFATESEFFVTLDLGLDPDMIESIAWAGPDNLNCTDCKWPTFLATKSETITVELTTISGCNATFEIQVNVTQVEKLPYFAPSGFTPDGDGMNDEFEFFTDATIASLEELLIFDRWGNMVYEAKEMNTVKWDGTVNGAVAEHGVFVYVARMKDIAGEEIMASGSIMLTR